jgi:hypothetical protein
MRPSDFAQVSTALHAVLRDTDKLQDLLAAEVELRRHQAHCPVCEKDEADDCEVAHELWDARLDVMDDLLEEYLGEGICLWCMGPLNGDHESHAV